MARRLSNPKHTGTTSHRRSHPSPQDVNTRRDDLAEELGLCEPSWEVENGSREGVGDPFQQGVVGFEGSVRECEWREDVKCSGWDQDSLMHAERSSFRPRTFDVWRRDNNAHVEHSLDCVNVRSRVGPAISPRVTMLWHSLHLQSSSRYALNTSPALRSIFASPGSLSARDGPREIIRTGFPASAACLTRRNAE